MIKIKIKIELRALVPKRDFWDTLNIFKSPPPLGMGEIFPLLWNPSTQKFIKFPNLTNKVQFFLIWNVSNLTRSDG